MGRSVDGADAMTGLDFSTSYNNETPEHCAMVAPYYLDTFEVTMSRFLAFVDHYDGWRAAGFPAEGQGTNPSVKPDPVVQTGWHSSFELPLSAAEFRQKLFCALDGVRNWPAEGDPAAMDLSLPIVCVTWWEAFAFCVWDGGRLPTEAEWEFAAAGGAENRLYPWGNQPPDCSIAASSECVVPMFPLPVGQLTAVGRFGQLDLASNVREWAVDSFGFYRSQNGVPLLCDNCLSANDSFKRSLKGGRLGDGSLSLRGVRRDGFSPHSRDSGLGLRCARN
jgi:formylglycine-generating enzyme required for sulfatase activity